MLNNRFFSIIFIRCLFNNRKFTTFVLSNHLLSWRSLLSTFVQALTASVHLQKMLRVFMAQETPLKNARRMSSFLSNKSRRTFLKNNGLTSSRESMKWSGTMTCRAFFSTMVALCHCLVLNKLLVSIRSSCGLICMDVRSRVRRKSNAWRLRFMLSGQNLPRWQYYSIPHVCFCLTT